MPPTGGTCARHDLRKPHGVTWAWPDASHPAHSWRSPSGGCGHPTDSPADRLSDGHRRCRNAFVILRSRHRRNPRGKAGAVRAVCDPGYAICPGHPVHSLCLQLARAQRRLVAERKRQRLSCLPRATAVGRAGRSSRRGDCLGMSHIGASILALLDSQRGETFARSCHRSATRSLGVTDAPSACVTRRHIVPIATVAGTTSRAGGLDKARRRSYW